MEISKRLRVRLLHSGWQGRFLYHKVLPQGKLPLYKGAPIQLYFTKFCILSFAVGHTEKLESEFPTDFITLKSLGHGDAKSDILICATNVSPVISRCRRVSMHFLGLRLTKQELPHIIAVTFPIANSSFLRPYPAFQFHL